jgi:hypothetical protein
MNVINDLVNTFFTPLFMSSTDLLLLFYLCGGTWKYIRNKRSWGWWFGLFVIPLVLSQYIFNGKTNGQANFFIFYAFHFLVLLAFSAKCIDAHRSARFYLVILSVLADDICLITFISVSRLLFNFDYIDFGSFENKVVSLVILLLLKIGVTSLIKRQTRKQIYGIESVFQALIIMLPALPYFFLRNYAFLLKIDPYYTPLVIHFLDILCGICALINMIVSERLAYQIRQNELLRMENLISKQHEQHLATLNTIETVNRKYHDLRHILRGIDSMQNIEEVKAYIHTVEGEIKDYELICNTGNKTLDIILSERMRECKEKGIQMHVHADGQGWGVVRDSDIASIFGNALDNAIESTEQIEDSSLRLIEVRIGQVNDMLIARFENQYTHVLEKKQTQLVSTKHDKRNHGYGLKSIELTVKQYGGELDIKTDGGPFTLTVIIPVVKDHSVENLEKIPGQPIEVNG